MHKYPKTLHYDAAFKQHRGDNCIEYRGTVKLHGTNGGIHIREDSVVLPQSRNRALTVEHDNHGFALFVQSKPPGFWNEVAKKMVPNRQSGELTIYGEWCGRGIQSGVGVSELEPMFVVFAVCVDEHWARLGRVNLGLDDERVYSITDLRFPVYDIMINFDTPNESLPLLNAVTKAVEDECPVARALGVKGVGEGLVWTPRRGLGGKVFKTKGSKHSTSKVKKLPSLKGPDRQLKVDTWVTGVVSPRRVEQGLEYLQEMELPVDRTSTGEFIKWCANDALAEDYISLQELGLTKKDVGKTLGVRFREKFFKTLDAPPENT